MPIQGAQRLQQDTEREIQEAVEQVRRTARAQSEERRRTCAQDLQLRFASELQRIREATAEELAETRAKKTSKEENVVVLLVGTKLPTPQALSPHALERIGWSKALEGSLAFVAKSADGPLASVPAYRQGTAQADGGPLALAAGSADGPLASGPPKPQAT